MKKIILALLAAILTVSNANAQMSLIATLNHSGNITAYYGPTALNSAHAAATNGDIITLSSGSFTACKITKAVTIRGAGLEYVDGVEPTILQGDFTIDVISDNSNVLTMEGIYHANTLYLTRAEKPLFFKCRFGYINSYYSSYGLLKNASFIHCKVASAIYLNANCSASFDNCVVYNPTRNNSNSYSYDTHYYFYNSVLKMTGNASYYTNNNYNNITPSNIAYSTLRNCVIYSSSTSNNSFPNTTIMYHNVCNVNCFGNSFNTTNTVFADFASLFKTWRGGSYDDEEKFTLTETAATKYVGDDGKQVGIHGGSLPYDPVPNHPKITKCDVAAKTTPDGKLSVNIEVTGSDY